MSSNELANKLKESASFDKKTPPKESWEFIANALHQKKKRRFIWLVLPAMFLVSISVWVIMQSNNSEVTEKKNDTTEADIKKDDKQNMQVIQVTPPKEVDVQMELDKKREVATGNSNIVQQNTSNNKIKKVEKNNDIKGRSDLYEAGLKIGESNKNKVEKISQLESGKTIVADEPVLQNKETEEISNTTIENSKELEDRKSLDTAKKTTEVVKTEMQLPKNVIKVKAPRKWINILQTEVGVLFVNKNNLFGQQEKVFETNMSLSLGNGSSNRRTPISGIYTNGLHLSIASIWEKKSKRKVNFQIGGTLQYQQFNSIGFKATNALITTQNGLSTDSTALITNSRYANVSTNGLDIASQKIRNKQWSIGVILGAKMPLAQLKNQNKILLQLQTIPFLNLSHRTYWYNQNNGRYFESRKLLHQFNAAQSTSILWSSKIKGKDFSFGPVYQFNWSKSNRTINGLQDISISRFSLQFQYSFNK